MPGISEIKEEFMALVINHNLTAATATRNLNKIYGSLSKSIERLSSGLRINSAADDAAGLAVREMMRADIAGSLQGIRNAADAVSMIQTADGALGVIDATLIRMKALAEQAATGTYTDFQREIINQEFQAMAADIDRIANATTFNGVKLLNGSMSNYNGGLGMRIHFGVNNVANEDYYYVSVGDVRATTATGLNIGHDNTNDIWSTGGNPYDDNPIPNCCGGNFSSMDQLIKPTSAGGIIFAYNWDLWAPGLAQNGDALTRADGLGRHMVGLYGLESGTTIGQLIEEVNQGSQSRVRIDISALGMAAAGTNYAVLCLGTEEAYYIGDRTAGSAATGGGADTKEVFGTLSTGTATAIALKINQSSQNFWAATSGNTLWVFSRTGGDVYNNVTVGIETNLATNNARVMFTNVETNATSRTVSQFSLGGNDWVKMEVVPGVNDSFGVALVGKNYGEGYDTKILKSTDATTLGHITGLHNAGVLTVIGSLSDGMAEVQDASDGKTSLRTQEAAQTALDTIKKAIEEKDKVRASLGVLQNRLEGTIEALTIQTENLQAAESRISDVDVAAEMTEFTKNNILAQAAASMVAQANSLSSLALILINV
jgi:flagellin